MKQERSTGTSPIRAPELGKRLQRHDPLRGMLFRVDSQIQAWALRAPLPGNWFCTRIDAPRPMGMTYLSLPTVSKVRRLSLHVSLRGCPDPGLDGVWQYAPALTVGEMRVELVASR